MAVLHAAQAVVACRQLGTDMRPTPLFCVDIRQDGPDPTSTWIRDVRGSGAWGAAPGGHVNPRRRGRRGWAWKGTNGELLRHLYGVPHAVAMVALGGGRLEAVTLARAVLVPGALHPLLHVGLILSNRVPHCRLRSLCGLEGVHDIQPYLYYARRPERGCRACRRLYETGESPWWAASGDELRRAVADLDAFRATPGAQSADGTVFWMGKPLFVERGV